MEYLAQRIDGAKVNLYYELNDDCTIYTIEFQQDEGILDVIRRDPGIWGVECWEGEVVRSVS